MFIDGLKIYQDFDIDLIPVQYRELFVKVDLQTGNLTDDFEERSHSFRHKASHSTSVGIRIRQGRIEVNGNPSRINRLDNLFGYTTIDQCVFVFNSILSEYQLPPFTKATKLNHLQSKDGKHSKQVTDGAVIQEIHLTTNRSIGEGNTHSYLKAISNQKYRNSMPNLHSNGCSVDWRSKLGKATLIYPTIYDKANELTVHLIPKIKREYGSQSKEFKYVKKLHQYCTEQGVIRFEQKLKSEYLRRHKLNHYGLINFEALKKLHQEFLDIDKRLKVNNMKLENISEQLINEGICKSTLSANCTAGYAYQWMHGSKMDLSKKQVQTHRARLRKIGIDIGLPCDLTRFSPVVVKDVQELHIKDLAVPHWYKKPVTQLQLVA